MKVRNIQQMGFSLTVLDPYILAFHHYDQYPEGGKNQGPKQMPKGKNDGQDFDQSAAWRMYHGDSVPGFPAHPHRGFETVTVVTQGLMDHFDSNGSKGRYGGGDVQWMTAGKGAQHSEMFPLVNQDGGNTVELFQIWLNLPKKNKFAEPNYKMFWNEDIPVITEVDDNNNQTSVKLIAGTYKGIHSIDPLPASWAYNRENHVGIWIIKLAPNAKFTIPSVSTTLNRILYNINGGEVTIEDDKLKHHYYAELDGNRNIAIQNGAKATELLLLEGEPINEPVVAHGPFVMNTTAELRQAFIDFQETEFGGWPWPTNDPVNNLNDGRFANYRNGEVIEYPKTKYNVINNKAKKRYEVAVDNFLAIADYIETGEGVVFMTHTEVPVELEGKGIGSALVKFALQDIKDRGLKVSPMCPFVRAYIERHPEWKSLIKTYNNNAK